VEDVVGYQDWASSTSRYNSTTSAPGSWHSATSANADYLPAEEESDEKPEHPFRIYGAARCEIKKPVRDARKFIKQFSPRRLQRFS
jgi:hypothetical protein